MRAVVQGGGAEPRVRCVPTNERRKQPLRTSVQSALERYFMDLDGAVVGSFSTVGINEEPFGLTFVGDTDSQLIADLCA